MLTTTIDIALPVLNEERGLQRSVETVSDWLSQHCPYRWTVSVVDNGSVDRSWELAVAVAGALPNVRALRLHQRGRGRALKAAWATSGADVLAYMDIDLSTELRALGPLLETVAEGRADVAIGSRLSRQAQVTRSLQREIISHLYNHIARAALGYRVRDAQCGFKAVSAEVARCIVPLVVDDSWFFDTELLVLAWRQGLRIQELPVRWVEDDDSRVRILTTAIDDLRGIWRLRRFGRRAPTDSPFDPAALIVDQVPAGASTPATAAGCDPGPSGPAASSPPPGPGAAHRPAAAAPGSAVDGGAPPESAGRPVRPGSAVPGGPAR